MANTLTGLIPTIYTTLDYVLRELVGIIPVVRRDSKLEQAALNQTVTFPVVPVNTASDITPAATGPDPSGQTIGYDTLSISKSRGVFFPWNGEELRSVGSNGTTIINDQFAQAFRTLVNEIESDLGNVYKSASRAYGTAGTTPFGSDLSDAAQILKMFEDNGSPTDDLHLVVDTAAGVNLFNRLNNVANTGSAATLRSGIIGNVDGLQIGKSAQIKSHTKGTGTEYQVNLEAGYAVGSTALAADSGSGTILAGDVLTNSESGRDTNKYIVKTALAAGALAIANPGLRNAWVNDDAIAVGNSYKANLAFHRNAIVLATRLPILPSGGDSADSDIIVQDPVTGLAFRIAEYKQFHQVSYEVSIAWGYKAVKPESIHILLG